MLKLKEKIEKKRSGIYMISNSVNTRVYIGSSRRLGRRYIEHRSSLLRGEHHSSRLRFFARKYPDADLYFEVVEYCDTSQLLQREQHFIDKYCAADKSKGFNMSPVAGSNLGFSHTDEWKRNMSESRSGAGGTNVKLTKEQVDFIRNGSGDLPISEIASMFAVTANCVRKVLKGRSWIDGYTPSAVKLKRSTKSMSIDTVRQIRALKGLKTQEELSAMFGTSRRNVCNILNRVTWSSIE